MKYLKNALSLVFFASGIYSVLSMERDFQHTSKLMIFFLCLFPIFLAMSIITRVASRYEALGHWSIKVHVLNWVSQYAMQSMTQYILMYCLPFFFKTQRWIYLTITAGLLITTLWDNLWERLILATTYRKFLRLWTFLSAGSFLWPFLFPKHLHEFYWGLSAFAIPALMPMRFEKKQFKSSAVLFCFTFLALLALPMSWRFPMLSVWLEKPHFATNENQKSLGVKVLTDELSLYEFKETLRQGNTICCVAPIVAPPGVRERVTQEWTLGGILLERPELKSSIQGNAEQRGFHSFFCKRNFPQLARDQTLLCQLSLQDSIFLGEIKLTIP